jgi:hypothetical protein
MHLSQSYVVEITSSVSDGCSVAEEIDDDGLVDEVLEEEADAHACQPKDRERSTSTSSRSRRCWG